MGSGQAHDLDCIGSTHRSGCRPMLERLARPGRLPEALVDLAGIVEPLKHYDRGQTMVYTSLTPLNRLVDAARPERDVGRNFTRLVDRYLADPRPADRDVLSARLQRWHELRAELEPVLTAPATAATRVAHQLVRPTAFVIPSSSLAGSVHGLG